MAVTKRYLLTRWSGFLPIVMSLVALCVVGLALATHATQQPDEGTLAHLWQLLVAGQIPLLGWFAVRWAPTAPTSGLLVLGTQIGAAFLALAPVLLLRL